MNKISRFTDQNGSAEILVMIVRDQESNAGRIEDVRFVSGSDALPGAMMALRAATLKDKLPKDSDAHLLRRGIVSCGASSGCSITFLRPDDVRSLE